MKTGTILKAAAAVVIAGALAYAAPALADPPSWAGHGHGSASSDDRDNDNDHGDSHDKGESRHQEDSHHHHGHHEVRLEEHDRVVLREYIGHHRDRWCPPGLAKKHNGCMPPGQLRYTVGARMPTTVRYEVLPGTVVRSLTPLPSEDIYVRTGGEIYVMNKRDRTIMDAVSLLNDLQ